MGVQYGDLIGPRFAHLKSKPHASTDWFEDYEKHTNKQNVISKVSVRAGAYEVNGRPMKERERMSREANVGNG